MTEDKNVGVDLSQNTPRKVKLRCKLHKKTSSLSYFRRKVHDLQFFTGSNSKEEQVLQFCYKKLSEPAFEILKLQLMKNCRKYSSKVGVCPRLFSVLSAKMLKVHEVEKICVLYIDEMSIKKSLEYNSRFGSILGFVDYGNGRREPKLANTALAFMNEKIYVLCDVPHLIKSVRNTLKYYNIRSNDGTAKWDDIRKCVCVKMG
ncbi:hypothetical protein Avbf_12402, partial [Armadillidium vulgare]